MIINYNCEVTIVTVSWQSLRSLCTGEAHTSTVAVLLDLLTDNYSV